MRRRSAETRTRALGTEPPPPLPQGAEPVDLDPAASSRRSTTRTGPWRRGSRWVYRETDREGTVQRVEVTVTAETKTILGIKATVVHDMVTEDGGGRRGHLRLVRPGHGGNVWYLGEDTKEYEDGKVVTTRAPGRPASTEPRPASSFRRPRGGPGLPAGVLRRRGRGRGDDPERRRAVEVPFGYFDDVLMTKDTTPLEPDLLEHKFYAEGVGPVLALTVSGGTDREELVSFEPGGAG